MTKNEGFNTVKGSFDKGQATMFKRLLVRFKWLIVSFVTLLGIFLLCAGILFANWNRKIDSALKEGWYRSGLSLYETAPRWTTNSLLPENLESFFKKRNYLKVASLTQITAKSWAQLSLKECSQYLQDQTLNCFVFKQKNNNFFFVFHDFEKIHLLLDQNKNALDSLELPPRLWFKLQGTQPVFHDSFSIEEVPHTCLQALLITEDQNFLKHRGVQFKSIMRAFIANLSAGSYRQGGSTLTQQLAKNLFLTPKKNIKRKVNELVIAMILEAKLNKDQLLELYLNSSFLGTRNNFQIIGWKSAAKAYYDKDLQNLTIPQCVALAASLKGPYSYGPFGKKHKKRVSHLLGKLKENQLYNGPLEAPQVSDSKNNNFTLTGMSALQNILQELKEKDLLNKDIPLDVYTSIDLSLQNQAEQAFDRHTKKHLVKDQQALAILTDSHSGEVRALIDGKAPRIFSQFNRMKNSKRSIGSLIKPFIFAVAFSSPELMGEEWSYKTLIANTPYEKETPQGMWKPENYDGKFSDLESVEVTLLKSLNIPTIRTLERLSPEVFTKHLDAWGFKDVPPYLSLALGALPLNPYQVSKLYLLLTSSGRSVEPHLIKKVTDPISKKVFFEHEAPDPMTLLHPDSISQIAEVLHKNTQVGSGWRISNTSSLKKRYAGKTGTTNNNRDAWFAGFNDSLLGIVWTGFDNNQAAKQSGSTSALPVWIQLMIEAEKLGY